jgi:Spy/CpxP family protein refolding chaperone
MRTNAFILGTAGALLLGALASAAQQGPAPPPKGKAPGEMQVESTARVLGLSAEQKLAYATIVEAQRPHEKTLRDEMRENRRALEQALEAESPDPATVGALVIQQRRLAQSGKALDDQASQTLRALLTVEQQTKLDVLQSMKASGPGGPMGPERRGPVAGPDFGPPPGPPPSETNQ